MRLFSLIFAILFLGIGILGFIPYFITYNQLAGLFQVNLGTNIIHLLIGFAAGFAAFKSYKASRLYFQIVGFILAGWALLGFIYGENPLLGIIANNGYNTWLHVIFSVSALILGFGGVKEN